MTIYQIRDFLMWCSVINIALMIVMFLLLSLGRGWVYKVHSKFFPITESHLMPLRTHLWESIRFWCGYSISFHGLRCRLSFDSYWLSILNLRIDSLFLLFVI